VDVPEDAPEDLPEQDQPERAELRPVDRWRRTTATGAVTAALALGFQQVFEPEKKDTIGIEQEVRPISGRWHRLPDGSERYLVDAIQLTSLTRELGGELLDPLKTTVVQNQRSMTTWVVRKKP